MQRKSLDSTVIIKGFVINEHDLVKNKTANNSHRINSDMEKAYMQRIADGDRDAFGQVVELYMTDIYRFAYSVLGDASRAEDIVQDTCLRLWNKADQWNPSGRLKSWLLRIAHNLCIDEIRGQKEEISVDVTTLAIPNSSPCQASLYDDQQRAQIVNAALFSLPERQRTALMLVYYQDHSNSESAYIMGLSVDAFESLLARGRQKLKDFLSDSKKALLEG